MLLELLLASSAIVASAKVTKRRRKGLVPKRKAQVLRDLVHASKAKVKKADDKYQTFMVKRFDPLIGADRQQQIAVSGKQTRELSTEEKELNRGILSSVVLIGTALVGNFLFRPVLILSLFFGLYISRFHLKRAYDDVFKEKKITSLVPGALNTLGVVFGRFFVIGGLFSLAFCLGDKLVLITQDRSFKSLINVFEKPESVFILVDGVETEIPFEEVKSGDQLLVRAGQTIPVDGTIIEGMATIDQHALTGEGQPAEKEEGDQIFASTIVLSGKIRIQVENSGETSVAAQISAILNNTADYQLGIKSKSERMSDKAVLPTILLGALAWPLAGIQSMIAIWGTNIGFNMRITGPIAMLNFLKIASKRGVLVKDGRSLELLHEVDTVVFDKTGTLTQEQPHVSHVHVCGLVTTDELLTYAAAAEFHQTHPIAKAILDEAKKQGISLPEIDQMHYEMGYGIKANIAGRSIRAGSDRYMSLEGISIPDDILEAQATGQAQGHSFVMVAIEDQLAGAIELQPTIRPEVTEVLLQLREHNLDVIIISGDQEEPTRKLAEQLGIDRYFANTLPEQKATLVEQLQDEGKTVCFIGDGINDSIALKKANVSVSLHGATTAATDTAQIVLMEESLHQLPFLFTLGKKFDSNMKSGFITSIIPGVSIISGAFLFHLGLAAALGVWATSFIVNMGVAMKPMSDKALLESDDSNTKALPDKTLGDGPEVILSNKGE